jgi:cytidine deaminase
VTNSELIAKAAAVLKPKQSGNHLIGDVGCALLTNSGNAYLGVCIEPPAAWDSAPSRTRWAR